METKNLPFELSLALALIARRKRVKENESSNTSKNKRKHFEPTQTIVEENSLQLKFLHFTIEMKNMNSKLEKAHDFDKNRITEQTSLLISNLYDLLELFSSLDSQKERTLITFTYFLPICSLLNEFSSHLPSLRTRLKMFNEKLISHILQEILSFSSQKVKFTKEDLPNNSGPPNEERKMYKTILLECCCKKEFSEDTILVIIQRACLSLNQNIPKLVKFFNSRDSFENESCSLWDTLEMQNHIQLHDNLCLLFEILSQLSKLCNKTVFERLQGSPSFIDNLRQIRSLFETVHLHTTPFLLLSKLQKEFFEILLQATCRCCIAFHQILLKDLLF